MARADLSRRVERVVGYPPLSEMSDLQRREFHEALLEADTFGRPGRQMAGGDPGGGTEPAEAARHEQRLSRPFTLEPREPDCDRVGEASRRA
jgi:hypothetical protein